MRPITTILVGAFAIVVIIILGGVAEKTVEAVAKSTEEEDNALYNSGHGSYPQGMTPEELLPAPKPASVTASVTEAGQ
jgi:hypothetical protein